MSARRQEGGHDPEVVQRWKRVLGAIVGLAGVFSFVLRMVGASSEVRTARVGAVIVAIVGMLWTGRFLVHARSGYGSWNPPPNDPRDLEWNAESRRSLRALLISEGAIGAGLLATGAWFFSHPNNWFELFIASAAGTLGLFVSSAIVRHTLWGGPPRGSETVNHCPSVRLLRDLAERMGSVPGVLWLDNLLWERRTPIFELSGFVVVLTLALFGVAFAQGGALAPRVMRYLDRRHGHSPPRSARHRPSAGVAKPAQRVPAPAVPPTVGDPAARHALPIPTYAALCGSSIAPGDGAREPEAAQLRNIWSSFGGVIAACAEPARRVPRTDGVYYVPGQCGGRFWSLAVASRNYPAAMLLGQGATLALELARSGQLRGASPRMPIDSGDFQVVYSSLGGYVLIRRDVTDGPGHEPSRARSCEQLSSGAERYVVLPPALADLWLQLGRMGRRTWPALDASHATPGRTFFTFYSTDPDPATVATGACWASGPCELDAAGITLRSIAGDGAAVTALRVLEDGP